MSDPFSLARPFRSVVGTRWKHNVTGRRCQVESWSWPECIVSLRWKNNKASEMHVNDLRRQFHEVEQ